MSYHQPTRTLRRRGPSAIAVAVLVMSALLGTASVSEAARPQGDVAPERGDPAAHTGSKQALTWGPPDRSGGFAEVARLAKARGQVQVTIALADAPTQAPTAAVKHRLASQAAAGRAAVLQALGGPEGTSGAPGAPMMTATVTAAEVAALRRDPAVRSISQSVELGVAGTSTFGGAGGVQLPHWWHQKRLGLDWTHANRYYGAGQRIVVVDTGVQAQHPWLTGRVVDGACFSRTGCGNGQTYRYGVAAGAPCGYSVACAHGTHVAHIAAGAHGAAPSAGIVAVNASHQGQDRYGRPTPKFNDADLVNALWYAYYHVSPAPAAVNMSIGSDTVYGSTCDAANQVMANWVSALRSRGTATVISAGNGNSAQGISYPACFSSAVVVGNSTLTGTNGGPAVLGGIAGGSNSSVLVDLWAPGTDICSAVPPALDADGRVDGISCGYTGTSMAAPQVAGAFAVLKSARSWYTVDQSLTALRRNGTALRDSRNNVVRSLISISNAVYYG